MQPRAAVLLGLFLVLITPRPSFAIWGWLEKLSGPGPFTGFELPFEFLCWESLDAEIIRKEDLKTVWASMSESEKSSGTPAEKGERLLRNARMHQRSKGDISRSLLSCSQDKSAYRRRGYSGPAGLGWFKGNRPSTAQYGTNNANVLQEVIGVGPQAREKRGEEEREVLDYYLRHSWKPAATLSFNWARYTSYRNDLADPEQADEPSAQATMNFYEALVGVEVLPSLEVGAGFGFTKVPGQAPGFPYPFHLVPVVATWKPFAAISDHPISYALMTRATFRYLPFELTRDSFAVPPASVSLPVYNERKEGIWSATVAVDFLILAQALKF